MDLERLAAVVAQAQEDKGISDYALEHHIGMPNGRAFNAKQISRWKAGERILPIPRQVVLRIIEILDLEPFETAELAGVFPPNVTADMLSRLREQANKDPEMASAQRGRVTGRYSIPAGQPRFVPVSPALGDPDELGEPVRRLRPHRPKLAMTPKLRAA